MISKPIHNEEKTRLRSAVTALVCDDLGFEDCRFTSPDVSDAMADYRDWLAAGHHGEMGYLERHLPFKENPEMLLPGVKSAIVVIKHYKNRPEKTNPDRHKIARYAAGQDYHHVIGNKLERVTTFLKEKNINSVWAVDSKPVAERALALKAGIGFRGKNSMVIKPGLGSYFFIAVIFTDYPFVEDPRLVWDCGQCRLCVDACPTDAILEDGGFDAPRCLSYQTIEQKTPMTGEQLAHSGGWLFGCDICQEVCPYNSDRIPLTDWPEFRPEAGVGFGIFRNPADAELLKRKDTPLHRSRKRVLANWQKGTDSSAP